MRLKEYSHRWATEVLANPEFNNLKGEIFDVLQRLPLIIYGEQPWSNSPAKQQAVYPVEQAALNKWLDHEFDLKGWEVHPKVTPDLDLKSDYKKGRVQIEVQYGNVARYAFDLMKFQVGYTTGNIDVGILVVPTQEFGTYIDQSIANFEKAERELPIFNPTITLPILVIGLDPNSYLGIPRRWNKSSGVHRDHPR